MDLAELERELDWLTRVIDRRFQRYFAQDGQGPAEGVRALTPPALGEASSTWAAWVQAYAPGFSERLALVLALTPQLRPRLLDVFYTKNATFDRRFTEFGGWRQDEDFEPTGETLAFLLDGGRIAGRAEVARLLDPDHPLHTEDLLRVAPQRPGQPRMKAPMRVPSDRVAELLTGERPRPTLGADFPAQRLVTALAWEDLVLNPATRGQVEELLTFLRHQRTLMEDWGMAARLRPGYRALFYGPPGTGKSLCAALLGKLTEREVYRVDLSLVVSKYIGETEKNLGRVFDRAQRRGWILFFDEADALFGKRSETRDSHDRYANQEVAYLLQRVESFDGVVILASNLRENLDDAFSRRFESVVYFPIPGPQERLALWREGFSPKAQIEVDLVRVAAEHELSGGAILNVIRDVSLQSIAEGERPIREVDLRRAIRRELQKEGRGA